MILNDAAHHGQGASGVRDPLPKRGAVASEWTPLAADGLSQREEVAEKTAAYVLEEYSFIWKGPTQLFSGASESDNAIISTIFSELRAIVGAGRNYVIHYSSHADYF